MSALVMTVLMTSDSILGSMPTIMILVQNSVLKLGFLSLFLLVEIYSWDNPPINIPKFQLQEVQLYPTSSYLSPLSACLYLFPGQMSIWQTQIIHKIPSPDIYWAENMMYTCYRSLSSSQSSFHCLSPILCQAWCFISCLCYQRSERMRVTENRD